MKIFFNNKEDCLEISIIGTGTAGISYDCNLEVTLKSKSFSGSTTTWIEGYDLKGFISELEALNTTLKGKAILGSASPDELHLEIKPIDNIGHFIFLIKIGRKTFIEGILCEASVSNAFPLESQEVSNICTKLISYLQNNLKETNNYFTLNSFKLLKNK